MNCDPCPFVVAAFVNGEDSLPLLRPAADLARGIAATNELAAEHQGRPVVLYAIDDRHLVTLLTVRK